MSVESDRGRLLDLLRALSFERRKVILASGKESDFYVDCKRTALTAEGHVLIGRLMFDRVRRLRPLVRGVGGLTLGADPLASAIALTSSLEGEPVDAFIVRKEPKGHGTGQWIEGRKTIPDGSRVAVLEDVVTTGGSALFPVVTTSSMITTRLPSGRVLRPSIHWPVPWPLGSLRTMKAS